MLATNNTPQRARWAVVWIAKGRVIRKDFDHEFAEALRIYTLASKADKSGVTLVCVNMGFPPPDKYADHEDTVVLKKFRVKGTKKVVTKKVPGEPRLILPRVYRVRMGELNRKGIWWCPFCVKLRRFKRYDAYEFEGIHVDTPTWSCPICGVSHNHGSVKMYNPYAERAGEELRRVRSDKGVSRG